MGATDYDRKHGWISSRTYENGGIAFFSRAFSFEILFLIARREITRITPIFFILPRKKEKNMEGKRIQLNERVWNTILLCLCLYSEKDSSNIKNVRTCMILRNIIFIRRWIFIDISSIFNSIYKYHIWNENSIMIFHSYPTFDSF